MGVSDVQATISASRKIVESIENNLNRNTLTQGLKNGSLKRSSVSSGDSGVSDEKSILERLASSPNEKKTSKSSSGMNKILQDLEQLIVSDDWHNQDAKRESLNGQASPNLDVLRKKNEAANHPYISELSRGILTSASLNGYINLLSTQQKQNIALWLYENTAQTLSTLFHTTNSGLFCSPHESACSNSIRAGIGHAVGLALRETYGSDYYTKGWKVFVEKGSPVVYVSPALHLDLALYLSSEFSIADVVVLQKLENVLSDIEARVDHEAFEKQIDDDIAAGKRPLIVIGMVGSPILGLNDMISRILEIRKSRNNFWIHVVGQGLAALCLKQPSKILMHVLSQADSFTIPLAQWVGAFGAPVLTIHRAVEIHQTSFREKLDCLPWWIASQYLTTNRMVNVIEYAFFLSKLLLQGISTFEKIEILGIDNIADYASRVNKGNIVPPSVLIFKYKYAELKALKKKRNNDLAIAPNLNGEAVDAEKKTNAGVNGVADNLDEFAVMSEYADSLNAWLGQGLISECRQLGLQVLDLGIHGTAFRFCPLETATINLTHAEHVYKFINQLTEALVIIESTVTAKKYLETVISEYPSLIILPIRKWAGVGAVCYIPSIVKETNPSEWNEKQRQQVSHLNLELVHSLRAIDTAFTTGESTTFGVSCVKFGMLSDDKDLTDLIRLVAERGKEIEQSQQYMDSLAEMIRRGIEAANDDLKRENDARLMQEGVMRQIPIMGSFVNWLSPLGKESQNIKGRSFDLKTGQIQSTEVYYKHRLMNESSTTALEPHQAISHHRLSNEPSNNNDELSDGDASGKLSRPVALSQ